MGASGVLHDGGHVGKVQIDDDVLAEAHQLGNGGHSLLQHIVGDAEGVGEGDLLVGDVFQPVVGNDDQRIDLAAEIGDALLSLTHPVRALELEGFGDNADREDTGLVSQIGHDGSRAGAGAAAHTGGDKDHVRAFQCLGNGSPGLLGGLLANLGLGACAHAAGQLLADLDLVLADGFIQILLIGVDHDEVHAAYTGIDHAVDNIVAGAADTDHLDFHNAILYSFGHNLFLLCIFRRHGGAAAA